MTSPTRNVTGERIGRDGLAGEWRREAKTDVVAVEEPLEIRISGETFAVTMRTPGHDRELVLGFLLAEGVIASARDVSTVTYCGRSTDEARENTIDVTLVPGVKPPVDLETGLLARRGTLTTSACGVCGRRSIDDLVARVAPLPLDPDQTIAASALVEAVRNLRERQPVFAETGGCHAASLVDLHGAHVATFEDVGRHNAVDKLVGSRMLAAAAEHAIARQGPPVGTGHVLVVSGRSSFEIVQKALSAKIPIVASVSAPSSLAVDLAGRANVTLAGFVRGESMTVFTAPARVRA